ncbi:hypothetical protein U9M48_002854 [Paspalum notatum var. saurae]|uniref:Uncharacterized protein n=1 Tax=Paspalum notatum var. saurae TaxID=547442 RepID=A0AAQ3PRL0_PASNO
MGLLRTPTWWRPHRPPPRRPPSSAASSTSALVVVPDAAPHLRLPLRRPSSSSTPVAVPDASPRPRPAACVLLSGGRRPPPRWPPTTARLRLVDASPLCLLICAAPPTTWPPVGPAAASTSRGHGAIRQSRVRRSSPTPDGRRDEVGLPFLPVPLSSITCPFDRGEKSKGDKARGTLRCTQLLMLLLLRLFFFPICNRVCVPIAHRPPPVDSCVIDIGFDNTGFLVFFDCVVGVACGVTGTLACVAPLRLHIALRRLVIAITDREAPPSTSPSPSSSPPRAPSAYVCCLSRDASPSKRAAAASPPRAAASPPIVVLAVASTRCRLYRCASLAHGLLRLFEFFANFKHRRCAIVASSRTSSLSVMAVSTLHLQEPRCVTMTTSSPSSSTTSSPVSPYRPRLLRPLRQPRAASAPSSSPFFCAP